MCVVSAVSQYYTDPLRWTNNPIETADEETKRLLREAIERLDKIDKRLKDIECQDEKKVDFLSRIGYINPIST